jgi:hypothetical protein
MTKEAEAVLDGFLERVKEVLPDFVLHNEERTEEIMARMKSDLLLRASEKGGGDKVIETGEVQAVIDEIPFIHKFADSYLKRGNPRFYITEELSPTYFRTLILAGLGIFIIILIPQLMKIGQEPGGKIVGYVFSGLFTAAVSVFSFVTIAFVGLSQLGIFPEDLARFRRKAKERAEKKMAAETAELRKVREEIKADWVRERGEERAERLRRKEERGRKREEIREKIQRNIEEDRQKKQGQSRVGEVVGAIFGILFGFFLIVQFPFGILNQSHPMFLSWLRVFGVVIVFRNLWKAVQALIPFERIWARRIVYALEELMGLLNVPLFLWLRENIPVVPAFSVSSQGFVVHEPSLRAAEILYWVFTGLVVLTIIGAIVGFIKSMAMKR